jgi:hypothetical protein
MAGGSDVHLLRLVVLAVRFVFAAQRLVQRRRDGRHLSLLGDGRIRPATRQHETGRASFTPYCGSDEAPLLRLQCSRILLQNLNDVPNAQVVRLAVLIGKVLEEEQGQLRRSFCLRMRIEWN